MRVRSSSSSRALVLLPGAQMYAAHIAQAGLPDALTESGVKLDLHVPDLHLDPVDSAAASRRLSEEVLAPLHEQYPEIWLGGISLGGMLALHHAQRDASGLSGLCLIAPYPGSRLTTNTIARAGGIEAWEPDERQRLDTEFQVWAGVRKGLPRLPVFMGYGKGDRFAGAMRPLAEELPDVSLHELDGGHDWSAWIPVWRRFLEWLDSPRRRRDDV